MRATTITLATATALLALAACSGPGHTEGEGPTPDDSGTPSPEPTVSVPAEHQGDDLEAAVAVYTGAYFAGDDTTAYGMLSRRCQGKITPEAYKNVVRQAAEDYGPDHPATDVKAEVSGAEGHATYKVKGLPRFDRRAQPWTLEDEAWKYDAC